MLNYGLRQIVLLSCLSFTLIACQNTTNTPPSTSQSPTQQKTLLFQDSTRYFLNKTGSVSMRATLKNTITADGNTQKPLVIQPLSEGYKLQFRTIQKNNMTIDSASIVAGGRCIPIIDTAFIVSPQKGITWQLSLQDTQFIHQQSNAVLRFKADGDSFRFAIKNHQLEPFLP